MSSSLAALHFSKCLSWSCRFEDCSTLGTKQDVHSEICYPDCAVLPVPTQGTRTALALTLKQRETPGFRNPPPYPHKANLTLRTDKQTAMLYTALISYHK